MEKKSNIPDILSDLLYKDLLGVLDEQEREEFQALCRKYQFEIPDREQLLEGLKETPRLDWMEAYQSFKKKNHKKRIGIWYRVAAAVVFFLGAGMLWLTHSGEVGSIQVAESEQIQPVSTKAIITLANGKQMELKEMKHRFVESDGTQFQAEAGELVYQEGDDSGELLYNTIAIPRGGEFRLVLSDGTKVWMNAGSELRYPVHFKADSREVDLQGEAYFEVAKHKDKTFIVNTSKGEIRVWGTSFNVRDYPEEAKVVTTLETGKVSYYSDIHRKEIMMQPGYMLEDRTGQELKPVQVNTALYCGWKDGKYIFDDLSLGEIMNTLERWYDVTVVYQSEKSRTLHFTGDLMRYEHIDTILNFIETGGDVYFEIQGKTIIVKEK